VRETKNDPSARAAAFELYLAARPDDAGVIVPTFLDDPSVALRRLAVTYHLKDAERYKGNDRSKFYRGLLAASRDMDQAEDIAKRLHDELSDRVDLAAHFGYVQTWHV